MYYLSKECVSGGACRPPKLSLVFGLRPEMDDTLRYDTNDTTDTYRTRFLSVSYRVSFRIVSESCRIISYGVYRIVGRAYRIVSYRSLQYDTIRYPSLVKTMEIAFVG